MIAGDIESNPGPTYNIVKFIKASFHQGNPMFGKTAGIQCACNALFSICWSKVKSIGCWKTCDVDYVLIKGDELFKNINLERYLEPRDLPKHLCVEGTDTMVEYVQLVTVDIKQGLYEFIRPSFVQLKQSSNGIIFFVEQMSFSLQWDSKAFYLFESHSRNEEGKVSPDGTAILLKFSSLKQVQFFITENYLINRNSVLAQMQYCKS